MARQDSAVRRPIPVLALGFYGEFVIVDCWGADPREAGASARSLQVVAMTSTPGVVGGVLVPAADPLFSVGERQAWPGSCPATAG
jgi:hypothetical protein